MPIYIDGKEYEDELSLSLGQSVEQQAPKEEDRRSAFQKLTGQFGERYQTWPEKMVRGAISGVTLPGDVSQGKVEPGSMQEIERAFELAGLMVAGPAPVAAKMADGTLGSFAGVKSKTLNKAKLYEAQEMEFAGKDKHDIWESAGFMRGSEGRWKYEISDQQAKLNNTGLEALDGGLVGVKLGKRPTLTAEALETMDDVALDAYFKIPGPRLSDILEHPELFQAYPHLKDIEIIPIPPSSPYLGMYSPSTNTISMKPGHPEQFRSTLMHEVQHAVQEYEGFARGGNPEMFMTKEFLAAKKEYEDIRSSAIKELEEQGLDVGTLETSVKYEQYGFLKDLPKDLQEAIQGHVSKAKELGVYNKLKNIAKSDRLIREEERRVHELYQRIAGEVEARNVQSRLNYEMLDRKHLPPWSTEDVSRHMQTLFE